MITDSELKYLDIAKIMSLPDSNNVHVTFFGLPGRPTPRPVIIGKKQFVRLLEKLAQDRMVQRFEYTHSRALQTAAEARRILWPKSLI